MRKSTRPFNASSNRPPDYYKVAESTGRLKVAKIVSREEAARFFGKEPWELWDGDDHLLADPRQLTEQRFHTEVPKTVLHQLQFLTTSGEITTVRFNDGHLDLQTLRAIRELTPQSAALLDRFVQPASDAVETDRGHEATEEKDRDETPEEHEPEDDHSPSHPKYLRHAAVRRAVELRAVDAASAHYSGLGYTVENTSATQPYDLCCRNGKEELRVEVKGSQGDGNEVFLTAGEVEHARGGGVRTDLFVWRNIKIVGDGKEISGMGGRLAFHRKRWNPAEADLTATQYCYRVGR